MLDVGRERAAFWFRPSNGHGWNLWKIPLACPNTSGEADSSYDGLAPIATVKRRTSRFQMRTFTVGQWSEHPVQEASQKSYCLIIGHDIYMMSDYWSEASVVIPTPYKPGASFPARVVETKIREALNEQAATQSVLRPRPVSACEPAIDSLVVVEIICAIEEAIGISLPPTFSPRGGYDTVEACVTGILDATRAVWVEIVKEKEHHER